MLRYSKSAKVQLDYRRFRVSANDEYDNRCIAPPQRRDRCNLLIDAQEADEVAALTIEIQQLAAECTRERLLSRTILLRCCGEHHRQKLEADPINLEKVARRYDELLKTIKCPTLVRYEPTPAEKEKTLQASKPRYFLRPRYADDRAEETDMELEIPLFTPYRSGPQDSVESYLSKDVSKTDKRPGFVYAFSWPTNPGYLKLGSSGSPSERLMEWQTCHPYAEMIHSIEVPFPKKAERLIHLEMSRVRYQIVLCRVCGRTHLEWFKTSVAEMRFVMNAWKRLFDEDIGLYDKTGKFSGDWDERIRKTCHDLTAKRLIGVFDSLQANAQRHSWSNKAQCHLKTAESSSRSQACDGSLVHDVELHDRIENRDWDVVAEYFDDFRQCTYRSQEW